MNDDDLVRVLDHRAGDVLPPADLLASVERRYRRRRAVRSGVGAAVLAVVAVVAVSVLRATGTSAPVPPAPEAPLPPPRDFAVPKALVEKVTFAEAFPGAVFDVPHRAPGNLHYTLVAPIDATHLLAFVVDPGATYAGFHRYDVTTKTFGPEISRASAAGGSGAAYGTRYYVWSSYTEDGANQLIRTVDLATGEVRAVAVVDASATGDPSDPAGWFTDDTSLYSSNASGVLRLPLHGGTFTAVPGFEGMEIRNGTPWAAKTAPSPVPVPKTEFLTELGKVDTELRNVETGQTVEVSAPADAKGLSCLPTICLGYGRSGPFIQHPDGSDRVALPFFPDVYPVQHQTWQLFPTAGGGLLAAADDGLAVIDPFTGANAIFGRLPADQPSNSGPSSLPVVGWNEHAVPEPGETFTDTDPTSVLVIPYLKGS